MVNSVTAAAATDALQAAAHHMLSALLRIKQTAPAALLILSLLVRQCHCQ
jgi:hypothetical protein